MGRKPRVDRTPEEKWQIVQEGLKNGNVPETCRRHGIAPNLFPMENPGYSLPAHAGARQCEPHSWP